MTVTKPGNGSCFFLNKLRLQTLEQLHNSKAQELAFYVLIGNHTHIIWFLAIMACFTRPSFCGESWFISSFYFLAFSLIRGSYVYKMVVKFDTFSHYRTNGWYFCVIIMLSRSFSCRPCRNMDCKKHQYSDAQPSWNEQSDDCFFTEVLCKAQGIT